MQKITYLLLSTTLIFGTVLPDQVPTDIFKEVRAGNTQAIRERIKNCEDCSKIDENGNNALHIAAEEATEEHQEIIDMLTTQPDYSEWGNWFYGFFYAPKLPEKNEKNKQGKVPLRSAMERGNIGATEKLIVKGANPNITDEEGISPVFSVVKNNKPELIPLLAKHQLIQQKQNGQNILHYAIKINQLPMVDRLAADNNLTQEEDNEGKTPAMLAAEKDDASCLRILHVKGVNVNIRNRFGQQPIHRSAIAGSYESANYLLEHTKTDVDSPDNNNDTPLLLSTIQGKKEVVDLFLAHKADITKRNKEGKDILALAVAHKHSELIKRFKNIPELDIDRRDTLGRTEFMNAVISKNYSMMSALYDCGAHPYIADHEGENVFHKIAKNNDSHGLSMIMSIQPEKKDYNKKNNLGNTPIFVATQNGNLNTIILFAQDEALLEETNNAGETIFHQIAKSKKPSVFTALMKKYKIQTNINTQSKAGFSPMHYASSYNDVEMMRNFAEYGASYTSLTPHDDTLAHTAAKSNALDSLKELKYRMPMMLQQRNKNNHTPFITAAAQGKLDATDFLLCEEWIINRDISTAINLAHQNNHTHIVRFLQKKEEDRMDACIALSNQPQAISNTEKDIHYFHQQLIAKNGWYLVNLALYQPSSPKHYSANDLYYMTEAQRTQIALEYKKLYKNAHERKKELSRELDRLIAQEQEEIRKEHERIRQERKAAKRREKEAVRAQMQAQEAAQKRAEEARIQAEQQKEFDHYAQEQQKKEAIKAQDDALKQHNEQKKKEDDLIAGQQAILDQGAANKALADAAKHKAALEKQQEYAPMNLQPSAQQNKVTATYECSACGKVSSAKTLPCRTCPKRICSACQKQNGGQCPTCWQTIGKFTQKENGECFINNEEICTKTNKKICTETTGVTPIPCDNCKINADRICKGCLDACVKDNDSKNLQGKCPYCTERKLDPKIIKIILNQK